MGSCTSPNSAPCSAMTSSRITSTAASKLFLEHSRPLICSSIQRPRQALASLVHHQSFVAGLHPFIALARARLELFYVQNGNVPAAVLDEAGFLQSIGDQGNAGAPDAEHLAQKLLGQIHLVGLGQVA